MGGEEMEGGGEEESPLRAAGIGREKQQERWGLYTMAGYTLASARAGASPCLMI